MQGARGKMLKGAGSIDHLSNEASTLRSTITFFISLIQVDLACSYCTEH